MKDGWHKIYGYEIFVLDNKLIRGVGNTGYYMTTTYPYRKAKEGWDREYYMTVDAFRAGVRRGTVKMF